MTGGSSRTRPRRISVRRAAFSRSRRTDAVVYANVWVRIPRLHPRLNVRLIWPTNSPGDSAVRRVAEGADLDTADQRFPTRAPAPARLSLAHPKPRKVPAAKPEINRQERVISTAYLAMIVMIVAFPALTGLAARLGA